MSVVYEMCPPEVQGTVLAAMKKYHKELHKVGVTVICLFADAGTDEQGKPNPSIVKGGVKYAAMISKTNTKLRAAGAADALMEIDKALWGELPKASQIALLDHELQHLALKLRKDMNPELDCCERPKLEMRHHDWHLTGFKAIVDRHGMAAIETISMTQFRMSEPGQLMFDLDLSAKATAVLKSMDKAAA